MSKIIKFTYFFKDLQNSCSEFPRLYVIWKKKKIQISVDDFMRMIQLCGFDGGNHII